MEASWELKPKIEAVLIAAGCEASLEALAKCLEVSVDKAEEAVREFELDLLGADRGIQLRRPPKACASRYWPSSPSSSRWRSRHQCHPRHRERLHG